MTWPRGIVRVADASVTPDLAMDWTQQLTERETEALKLMMAGKLNGEIAGLLGTTLRTAEDHVAAVYAKLNARHRVDAIRRGIWYLLANGG